MINNSKIHIPQKQQTSAGEIPTTKYRYLVDFRTFTWRISKMPMQVILDRFLRSSKSKQYNLNIYEKMILIMLASFMGDQLNCWPSFKTLKEECSMSDDSLSKYIQSLEDKNLLSVKRKKNKNNEYQFTKVIHSAIIPTRSERVPTRWERSRVPAGSGSNNINNNINNNKGIFQKSFYQEMSNYKPSESGKSVSPNHIDYEKHKKVT